MLSKTIDIILSFDHLSTFSSLINTNTMTTFATTLSHRGLLYIHIHMRPRRQSLAAMTDGGFAHPSPSLFCFLFSFYRLVQYHQRASHLMLACSPSSSTALAVVPSKQPSSSSPEASWRLFVTVIEAIVNKYAINQSIKEVFDEDCPEFDTKDAKLFRKEWSKALQRYTSNAYGYINQILRGQRDITEIAAAEGEIHGTRQALRYLRQKKKKTVVVGKVYRGENCIRPELARLRRGMIFDDKAFLSTTTNEEVVKSFMGDSAGVHITLTSRTGVDVKKFSKHQKEDEVLFGPGTKFLVEHAEQKEKILFLQLKELKYQRK